MVIENALVLKNPLSAYSRQCSVKIFANLSNLKNNTSIIILNYIKLSTNLLRQKVSQEKCGKIDFEKAHVDKF